VVSIVNNSSVAFDTRKVGARINGFVEG